MNDQIDWGSNEDLADYYHGQGLAASDIVGRDLMLDVGRQGARDLSICSGFFGIKSIMLADGWMDGNCMDIPGKEYVCGGDMGEMEGRDCC